ncbi:MAG: hypothetical protein HC820_08100 [Hydrococcus sp. RM1_1_31]|nr:hypothetical protein [Hydrococcus sp. RM1_1_31]
MTIKPSCVFLDTNVYIVGAIDLGSYERQILNWAGFEESKNTGVEVVFSNH